MPVDLATPDPWKASHENDAGRPGRPAPLHPVDEPPARVEADRYRQMAADVGGHFGVARTSEREKTLR